MSTQKMLMTLVLAVLLAACGTVRAADWPQEMGPTRSGYTPEEVELSGIDPEDPKPLWVANAGVGAAPPAVVGDRVYVNGYFSRSADLTDGIQEVDRAYYSAENRLAEGVEYPRPNRPELTNMTFNGSQGGPMYLVDEYALCFDLESGKLLWASALQNEVAVNHYHYPRATPLVHDGLVYFHSWNGFLTAVNGITGKRAWQVDLVDYGANVSTKGTKGGNWSGAVFAVGSVIVPFGTAQTGMNVIALGPQSGTKKWLTEVGGAFRGSKTSLNLGIVDGKETVVLSGGLTGEPESRSDTLGIDPETGKPLWVFDYFNQLLVEGENRVTWPGRIPLIVDGVVIDSSMVGVKSEQARLYAFTVEDGTPHALWSHRWPIRHFGQMVVKDDYLYVYDDAINKNENAPHGGWGPRPLGMGAFQCIEVHTGDKAWITDQVDDLAQHGSFRQGNPHYTIAGNTVIFHQHNGILYGPISPEGSGPFTFVDFQSLGDKGMTQPVVANGHLLLRRLGGDVGEARTREGMAPATAGGITLVCFQVYPE